MQKARNHARNPRQEALHIAIGEEAPSSQKVACKPKEEEKITI
jgi:hypothetical protein